MKNNNFIKVLTLLLAVVTLFSCEKFNDDEALESKEANSTLVVRTRAASGDGTENEITGTISTPINIYVFDEDGKCVAASTMGSVEDNLSVKLPEGTYDVYAVAGASSVAYDLPTQETATKQSVLALKDGQPHGDLMTANNKVTLLYGGENTLTLTLERRVMLLESVIINKVPENVTGVSVKVRPLYENLLLDGSYSGEDGECSVELTKDADGSTWRNTDGIYLLEAIGRPTVEVEFTINGKPVCYSYKCEQELEANYKITIAGTFTGDGVELKGSITGVEWADTKDIVFDFGGNGSVETDEGGEDETNDIPEVGTLYNGCYVLRSEDVGSETIITFMSAKSKSALEFTEGDQESIRQAVNKAISELAVDGITGWRLPTKEEMEYIATDKNLQFIVEKTIALKRENPGLVDNFLYSGYWYYFNTEDGISAYNVTQDDGDVRIPPSKGSSFILRAFTTKTYPN